MMNKKRINIKIILYFLLIIVSVVILSYVRETLHKNAKKYIEDNSIFAKNVSDDNILKKEFEKKFPERKIIIACEEDITGDSVKDLVVISSYGDLIETIALIDNKTNYIFTEPIPAPRENQMIKFFNMDKDNITEVLITGEKKGQVGYAIYRYIDEKLIDIFGEGMEDCC